MIESNNVFRTIELLLKLQSVAEERFVLKRDKKIYKNDLGKQENEIKEKKHKCIEIEKQIDNLKNDIIDRESKTSFNKEQIKKIKDKEKQVRTQKEFIALDTELSIKQDGIKELEEDIKEKNKAIKALLSKLDNEKVELTKYELIFDEKTIETEIKIDEIDNKLIEINKIVNVVKPQLDSEVLAKYDNIVENKDGVGIVPVIDNTCNGCNLNVTAHVVSQIRKGEEIIYCSNCARILYLP